MLKIADLSWRSNFGRKVIAPPSKKKKKIKLLWNVEYLTKIIHTRVYDPEYICQMISNIMR